MCRTLAVSWLSRNVACALLRCQHPVRADVAGPRAEKEANTTVAEVLTEHKLAILAEEQLEKHIVQVRVSDVNGGAVVQSDSATEPYTGGAALSERGAPQREIDEQDMSYFKFVLSAKRFKRARGQ